MEFSLKFLSAISQIGRKLLEQVYYSCMPSYGQDGSDPYSDLPVKFPVLREYFLPHVMYATEVDKTRNRVGMQYMFLFFKTLIHTLQQYPQFFDDLPPTDLFWSEKRAHEGLNSRRLIAEHGWLPRSGYQISGCGANGRGAPPELNSADSYLKILGGNDNVRCRLQRLNEVYYSNLPKAPIIDFTNEYIVVPMQVGNDLNLRDSSTKFSKYYGDDNSTQLFAADLIATITGLDLPYPVYFTQHPVDRGNHKIELRKHDRLFTSTSGVPTLSLIRNPHCRGMISVNSNMVHEALCLNIPCCVLGRLYWREGQASPFESDPVKFFSDTLLRPHDNPVVLNYLAKLLCHQWHLTDLQNPLIIRDIILNDSSLIPFQVREKFSVI